MNDEAHHIARQAAALDDPRLCRDSGSVTDAQDEAGQWQRIDREDSVMLYTLRTESYRRGTPQMVNDVMVNITRGHGSSADLKATADLIATAPARPSQAGDGWTKKAKGSGFIYTHPDADGAVVDRRGYGINAAAGANITWQGVPFASVDEAKKAALAAMDTPKGGGDE